jgi:metal transporter CNNM
MIGAKAVPCVRLFMAVLFPFAWPISVLLDKLLGEEMGAVYDKKRIADVVKFAVADEVHRC